MRRSLLHHHNRHPSVWEDWPLHHHTDILACLGSTQQRGDSNVYFMRNHRFQIYIYFATSWMIHPAAPAACTCMASHSQEDRGKKANLHVTAHRAGFGGPGADRPGPVAVALQHMAGAVPPILREPSCTPPAISLFESCILLQEFTTETMSDL